MAVYQRLPTGPIALTGRNIGRRVMHLAAIALALVIFPVPSAAEAQQARTVRIGHVYPTLLPHIVAFKQAVRDLGYVEGRHVIFEERALGASPPARVQEILAALIPDTDLLVVWGTVAATAAKKVTTTLPTVFLSVGDPVATGLVPNLARPGGNMTGVTFEAAAETYGKRLQLLKEIVPDLTRVAVLRPVGDPNAVVAVASLEQAAQSLAVQLMSVDVRSAKDLDPAFAEIKRKSAQGVMVVAGAFTVSNGQRIADLALAHRLPSAHVYLETVAAGGLFSLGPALLEIARTGAAYVDKILKGAKPGHLPVEQPTRYVLHINLKTAKALGLTIPPSLLVRADRVIE